MQSVCVFCGSSDQVADEYLEAAYQLGATLAAQNLTLVFGGGKTGLMGAVANGTLENGGKVIGVITESMNTPALAHAGLTKMEVSPNIVQRKLRMMTLADAFIALPGGMGTLDELFDVLTRLQIGEQKKAVGVLNVKGFYDDLLRLLDRYTEQGFILPEHRQMLRVHQEAQPLLEALRNFAYPQESVKAWLRED